MRAVLTRVNSASVAIDGEVVGKIGKGFLILLGVGPDDTEKECRYLAEKALGLRIFTDENDKMNLGLDAVENDLVYFNRAGAALPHRTMNILRSMPNVIVSPHNAFYTDVNVASMVRSGFEELTDFAVGRSNPCEVSL